MTQPDDHPQHPCEFGYRPHWRNYQPEKRLQTERQLDAALEVLDVKCKRGAREYCPDGITEFATDMHRDPFNEVRGWIAELRKQQERK